MINHKNYEIWFLDFAEGNLSERQIELLMDFLAQNDDLKAEFDQMELVELPLDDALVFDDKERLKRPLTADISLTDDDKRLIGHLEGDLSVEEVSQLQDLLAQNPALAKAQKYYEVSRLTPDLAVKYPDKYELKRKDHKSVPFRLLMQIAAAILLLVVLIFALRKEELTEAVEMPVVETPTHVPAPSIHKEQEDVPERVEEVVDIPKPIIEQAIVPLPRKHRTPKTRISKVDDAVVSIPEQKKPLEVIVNQEPKSPKTPPQMQAPPKPQMEPELPESKPVIAFKKPNNQEPKATFVNQKAVPTKRLIALNKPKDFLRSVVDKGIKKMAKKEGIKEKLSVPEAIVSTVGAVTKTKTSYKKKQTKDAKRISVSIGRFKFSRVKHRGR